MDRDALPGTIRALVAGARRLVIAGVGSDVRNDDAIGSLVARDVITGLHREASARGIIPARIVENELIELRNVLIIDTCVVPEQFITTIHEFNPDLVIILDAAVMAGETMPGDIFFVNESELDGTTFSTHTLPLRQFIEVLQALGTAATFRIVGIQPANLDHGEVLSPAVTDAKIFLGSMLLQCILDAFL